MAATILRGTAYITGAGSGIGRATAVAFARSGIQNLVLVDRNPTGLSSVSSQIKKEFPEVEVDASELDVAGTEAVTASVLNAAKKFGRIDVAVNVAGISPDGVRTHETNEENWREVLDIDLSGVWRSQRAQLMVMMGQEDLGPRYGRGTIVNVASMFGLTGPAPGIAATSYTAAKHGVIGLTRADAVGYAPHKIRINAIAPGYTDTPFLGDAATNGYMDPEIAKVPMGRFGQPEEIADSIVFLASSWSSYVNGAVLVADGGYSTT